MKGSVIFVAEGSRANALAVLYPSAEQRGLKPVIVPLRSKRPRYLGGCGALQVLMCGSEANRATAGDLPQPQAHFKLQSKNFFDLGHGQSPAGNLILPFEGRPPAIVLSSAAICLWKSFRQSRTRFQDWPETVRLHPVTGVHLHPRNPVRDHPATPFGIIPESRSPCPGSQTSFTQHWTDPRK
jgi:hypothetical protein